MDRPGPWTFMPSQPLQNLYFNHVSQQNLPRDQDEHRGFQQQRSHLQSVNLQQSLSSTEVQKPVLEGNSTLCKTTIQPTENSTHPVKDCKDTSKVSKSSEVPKYSLGHNQQTVKTQDIVHSKLLSQVNFQFERDETIRKALLKPKMSSKPISIQPIKNLNSEVTTTLAMKPVNSKIKKTVKPMKPKEKIVMTVADSKFRVNVITPRLKDKKIKDLMCYLCQKSIKEEHFGEHLFFGAVRCTHCKEEFLQCHSFMVMVVNRNMGRVTCEHSLQYCSDPFDYISAKLSGDSSGNLNGALVPSYVLKKLSFYVGQMSVLEKKDPWQSAILQCKTLLPSAVTKSAENTNSLSEPNPNSGNSKILPAVSTALTPSQINHSNQKDIHPKTKSPEIYQEIHPIRKNPTLILPNLKQNGYEQVHEDDAGDLLLSQNYGLEQLEQAVEYVEVAGQCKLQQSNMPKKPRPYKKRKSAKNRFSPLVIGKDEPAEEEMSLEFIETPTNGYYYVVRSAVEECPMCYTVLCPSECTVNVETFLVTVVCSGCNLVIYIVSDFPDGPSVSIVTEKSNENKKEPKPEENLKKKRKYTKCVKENITFYPSKAKEFFAK